MAETLNLLRAAAGIVSGRRAYGPPLLANVSLTNRCNVRCRHCYFLSPLLQRPAAQAHRSSEEPFRSAAEPPSTAPPLADCDPATTARLLDDLLAMGTRRFAFSGAGEPFLFPDILPLFRRVRRKKAFCSVNTNGTLLSPERLDELVEIGFSRLYVTTMAGTAGIYVRTHPGSPAAVFDRLRDNLHHLEARKRSRRTSWPRLTLVCVVTRDNGDDLAAFADFAVSAGAEQVQFRPLDDMADPGLNDLVPGVEQSLRVSAQLAAIRTTLERRGTRHNIGEFLRVFRSRLDTRALYRRIPCYYGWTSLFADIDGRIYPCCRCYDALGDLHERPVREIWYSPAYDRFRRRAFRLPRRDEPLPNCGCDKCPHSLANIRTHRALHPLARRGGV